MAMVVVVVVVLWWHDGEGDGDVCLLFDTGT